MGYQRRVHGDSTARRDDGDRRQRPGVRRGVCVLGVHGGVPRHRVVLPRGDGRRVHAVDEEGARLVDQGVVRVSRAAVHRRSHAVLRVRGELFGAVRVLADVEAVSVHRLYERRVFGSLAAMGATHWVWVRHFHSTYHSTEYVLGFFFMIVWFVPFGFFISIAANESVLPGGATVPGAPSSGNLGGYDPNRGGGKKTRNALLMLLDTLKLYWTRLSERFMPKGGIPGTYRDTHQKGW